MSGVRAFIARLLRWTSHLRRLNVAVVDDVPEKCAPGTLYLIGLPNHFWAVALTCPCGCGDDVHLPLVPKASPRWKLREISDGLYSLHPSDGDEKDV